MNEMGSYPCNDSDFSKVEKENAKKTLAREFQKCIQSLTPAESWFIQALLNDEISNGTSNNYSKNIDDEDEEGNTVNAVDMNHHHHHEKQQIMYLTKAADKLSDENLFSSSLVIDPPMSIVELLQQEELSSLKQNQPAQIRKARRPSNKALWKSYEDGIHPVQLKRLGSRTSIINTSRHSSVNDAVEQLKHQQESIYQSDTSTNIILLEGEDNDDAESDKEILPARDDNDDGSSWDSQNDADHQKFDAWDVLKDEYANDFGFDFTRHVSANDVLQYNEDNIPNSFQILGTSADDKLVQPHVMSPPMMDSIMNFLPDSIIGQNFWLRYSLVRDGASLDTLKRYVRATEYTIIAIETENGEVFGSFTSSPWHHQYRFFGSTPAFVWKMRHSRQTKCTSLFDQAQLESEIDVYMALEGSENHIQVCRHDALGVGGDDKDNDEVSLRHINSWKQFGFAFYLDSDMVRGTTSQSTTFHSPSLCGTDGNKTQIFNVAGLEVWSLTPCFTVPDAEKLEMTKFFIEESIRNLSVPRTPNNSSRSNSNFSNDEFLDRRKFYQRVGHDAESQARRDRWEYMNTMNTTGQSGNKGLNSSPRFGYDKTS